MNLFIHAFRSSQLRAITARKVISTLYMLKLRFHRRIVWKNVKPFTCLPKTTMRTLAYKNSSGVAALHKNWLNIIGGDHSIGPIRNAYSWRIILIVKADYLMIKYISLRAFWKIVLIIVLSSIILKMRLQLLMKICMRKIFSLGFRRLDKSFRFWILSTCGKSIRNNFIFDRYIEMNGRRWSRC